MEHVPERCSPLRGGEMEAGMEDEGTAIGHLVPGVACLGFGLLWTYNGVFRYHAARKQALLQGRGESNLHYRSEIFSKYQSSYWTVAEPYGAIGAGIIGFCSETIGILMMKPITMAIHHYLMYFFYAFAGLCAVLRHRKYLMPPGAVHAVFLTANICEGFLFMNHHLSGVSQQMHLTVSVLSFITALCVAAEMANMGSIAATLGRTLSFAAQGIWLSIMSFLLYPNPIFPAWEAEEQTKMDKATLLLVITVAAVVLTGFVMNALANHRVKSLSLATLNCIVASWGGTADSEKQRMLDSDDKV